MNNASYIERHQENRELFKKHFNLSDDDLSYLWELFMEYGMTRGEGHNRTKGNHYFLQGICQYQSVEFKHHGKKLSPIVSDIIKNRYPQLMVQNKEFMWE